MAIDKIEWHLNEKFPKNVPEENAGTHIGFYLEWIMKNDLGPNNEETHDLEEYKKVKTGEVNGRDFLINNCDSKFWDVDLGEEGLKFTKYIYDLYLSELENIFGESPFLVDYNEKSYFKVASYLDEKYKSWISEGKPSK